MLDSKKGSLRLLLGVLAAYLVTNINMDNIEIAIFKFRDIAAKPGIHTVAFKGGP